MLCESLMLFVCYAGCCNETAVLVSPEQFVAYPELPQRLSKLSMIVGFAEYG